MTLSVRLAPFGRPAARALREEIDVAQRDDPFSALTVVVPRGSVGLATRRLLASGDLGPGASGRPGLVNVRFVTAPALADELGGPALAASGRRPATAAVLDAAVRAALAAEAGELLGPVRHHPATVRALGAAYRDLRGVPGPARRRLAAQSARAAEVLGLAEAVGARLADWYDETDLADAARGAVLSGRGPAGGVAAYVWFLPLSAPPHVERLVEAVAQRSAVTVVIGSTGRAAPDSSARALLERLAPAPHLPGLAPAPDDPPARPLVAMAPPSGTEVLSAPSADTEVLATIRALMARNAGGVPLERMAIAYAGAPPYPRLVRELLDQAGIPSNGAAPRPLSATMAGRTLLGGFELAEGDWARDDVVSWLAGAPILAGGRQVPATAWDLVSREAGVLGGIGNWTSHLAAFTEKLRQRLGRDAQDDESPDEAERWRRQLAVSQEMLAFVTALAARFVDARRSWAEWAGWAEALLEDYLGGPTRHTGWPAPEVEALTAVREALSRLTVLDGIEPGADGATFRAALSSELEDPAPQTTRFGRGVLVGRVTEMVGLDLDVLFVLGMNDGAFPAPARDDALLPDAERAEGGPQIPLRAVRADEAERDYLAALLAAPERVLSFARGGQSHGRELRPSRWLLDTLGVVTGSSGRLYSGDLAGLAGSGGYRVLASFTAAVRAEGEPASPADRDLRSLLEFHEATGTLEGHYLLGIDPVLGAGLAARHQRRTGGFTRFEGNIAGEGPALSVAERQVSPTGLETYAACPRRYLFSRVLRVLVRERPEDVLRMSPRDRGLLVHEVLEEFVGAEIGVRREDRIQPATRWGPEGHHRMDEVARAAFARFEQAGLVGRPLLWGFDRAQILRDLHRFVEADDAHRAHFDVVPDEVEFTFGGDEAAPVEVALSAGRRVRFRGRIDRVDRAADGSVVVIDYKTGSRYGMDELSTDPVARGTKLQLVVYGLAARGRHGDVAVRSLYWFVSDKGGFEQVGYPLDPERTGRFAEALEVVAAGIESGAFPAHPGAAANGEYANCRFCDFKAACPGERGRTWARLRHAPELARYAALAEPDGEVAP